MGSRRNTWGGREGESVIASEYVRLSVEKLKETTIERCQALTKTLFGGRGEGVPYKIYRGDRFKVLNEPLKDTRIVYYGRALNSLSPLRGTNS